MSHRQPIKRTPEPAIELVTEKDACEILSRPPVKPRGTPDEISYDDFAFVRTAQVRLRWNHSTQEWYWEKPQGISTYARDTVDRKKPEPAQLK